MNLSPKQNCKPPLRGLIILLVCLSGLATRSVHGNPPDYRLHLPTSDHAELHQTIGEQVRGDSAFGGSLGLTTGWWNDMARLHLAGYTSQEFAGNTSGTGTGILAPDDHGYTVLGEAWLILNYRKSF